MHLKPAGQLRHRLFTIEGFQRYLGLERWAVLPASLFHALLLLSLSLILVAEPALNNLSEFRGPAHLSSHWGPPQTACCRVATSLTGEQEIPRLSAAIHKRGGPLPGPPLR